uniref:ATP synthase subunit epsilon, mitochondrial n=1 Tax=Syphacia muris TaxID=451379 RepID=A0A0N5A944_9BILA
MWRIAGLTYVHFSRIATMVTRMCSKTAKSQNVAKASTTLKFIPWENGKPVKEDRE